MVISDLVKMINWEIHKIKCRTYGNVIGWGLLCLYFIYCPQFLNFLYPYLPHNNRYLMYVAGTFLSKQISLVIINSFYFVIYKLNHPYFEQYKVNPEPWPWEKEDWPEFFSKVWKCVLFNQLCVTLPAVLFFGLSTNYDHSMREITGYEVVSQILTFVFFEDFTFYVNHRILHLKWFYGRFHKRHHDSKVNFAFAAEYATPVDIVLGNSIPVAMGPLVYGQHRVHIMTWCCWILIRATLAAEAHSGYIFPWSPMRIYPFSANSTFHDYHHYKNRGNYSSIFIIWDAVFGTHRNYMERHEHDSMKLTKSD